MPEPVQVIVSIPMGQSVKLVGNGHFNDYEHRLKLDYILVRMRNEFEKYKEHVRELMKVRYKIEPPPGAQGISLTAGGCPAP